MINIAEMPKYDAYKDSGIDWLGNIPSSWDLKPGLVALVESKLDNKGMKEDTVLSLSYGKIIIKPIEKLVGQVPESFETYQLVQPDDIIIRCTDLQNDKVSLRTGLARNKGIITSAYVNLRVKKGFEARFVHYYLHSLDTTKVIYKFGSGLRQNLSFLDFKRLPIPEISKEKQTLIANFLDQKTAQIDEAIAIKEQQINLLKERKQIIIQQAVTQGLDPNVPMKDSGVDWIGEIPQHWEVASVKHATKVISKGTTPSTIGREILEQGEIRFIKAENLVEGNITNIPLCFIDKKTNDLLLRSSLQVGDVLFVIAGATLGKTAVVSEEVYPANTNQAVAFLRPNKLIEPTYLPLWLSSNIINQLIWLDAVQSAQPNLSMEDLGNFPLIVPPRVEQLEIMRAVAAKIKDVDEAISLQMSQINALKEYKTTLINSAVTGKIKITQEMVEQ